MEIVDEAFKRLEAAKSIEEIDRIVVDLRINKKYHFDVKKYPSLEFKITNEEINELKEKGIITQDHSLSNISETEDPFIRLLYAVLWKNGDLLKIKHVINGILSEDKDVNENALVFFQLGKYLADDSEPIIDQHIVRAFGVYKATTIKEKKEFLNMSQVSNKHIKLIIEYKEWLKSLTGKLNENAYFHVDKVLFAVGKSIKAKKKEKGSPIDDKP
jgi:hypothetical protein